MSSLNVSAPRVRLLIDEGLCNRLVRLDDRQYETFRAAVEFAQDTIGRRLEAAVELPAYIISYADLELVVTFCRTRERFVLRALFELGDDTPPPGSPAGSPLPVTHAEKLLSAAGVREFYCREPGPGPSGHLVSDDAVKAVSSSATVVGAASWMALVSVAGLGVSGSVVLVTAAIRKSETAFDLEFVLPPKVRTGASGAPTEAEASKPAPSPVRAPGTSTDP